MIKRWLTWVVTASALYSVDALADAQCAPYLAGNTWNLSCAADPGDGEDDYQCDYMIAVSYAQGEPDQEEATGSVSPGQSGVIIWSEDVNGEGGDVITGVSVASGSCGQ